MQINDDKPYDDINITPMLDLAYVLVVIFIIMTTASVQGVKVDLPKGSSTVSLAVPKTKVISVSNEGQIFIDAIPVSLAELEAKLRDAKAITPDLPIVLKGDRGVQYEKIMNVLDICGRVGITSIGLAAQRTPGS
jgi:biopolymer transport protein ExbD